jgi:D-amino-acid dehydrogenase
MKAVIIGGGIMGLSSAYYLTKAGHQVTIIDQTDLSNTCSHGNLGMIVPSHFVPMAAPGIVSQGIRWMFNSRSPFYVKPTPSRSLIGWGLKFIRSANATHVTNSAPHLKNINLLSKKLYEDLSTEPGFDFAFQKKGIMMYFKTQKVADEEIHLAEIAQGLGLDAVALNREEIHQLEPEVKPDVLGAVHYKCDAHINPNTLLSQLVQFLKNSGTVFKTRYPVEQIIRKNQAIDSVLVNGENIRGDVFVAAAGSWMPSLLKLAGVNLPLMPGKGYSFIQENQQPQLRVPAILCEARVAITPMGSQLRFGGTMEIGAVNDRINMKRVEGIVNAIPEYLPAIQPSLPPKEKIWFGFRPCSPDGMPYIGFSNTYKNLLIAGGHGMMGLSLGLGTGRLVSELADNLPTSIDISAFNPSRFD